MCEIEGNYLTSASTAASGLRAIFSLAPTGFVPWCMVIAGEPGVVIRGKKGSGGVKVKKTGLALISGMVSMTNQLTPGDYLLEQRF
ncbi:hypothetical protein QQ045_010345 [Rhodiola kirilowii]